MSWSLNTDGQSTYGTATIHTLNITPSANSRLLVIDIWLLGAQITRTGGAPTFNGTQTFSDSGAGAVSATGHETTVETWYLLNPGSGSQVQVPNSGAVNMSISVSSWIPSAGGAAVDKFNSGTGTGANPSISVTAVAANALMIGNMGSGYRTVPTAGTNYTMLNSYDAGNTVWGDEYDLDTGTAGNITVGFTQVSEGWEIIGISFKETAPSYSLTVQNSQQAQTTSTIGLTQHYIIATTGSATQLHNSDTITLVQNYVLSTVNAASHAQTSDNVIITYHQFTATLTVNDATHAHTTENVTLLNIRYTLSLVQDSVQSHTSENIILTARGPPLVVQDANQAQTCDNVVLIQNYSLSIQNSEQGQTSDNISLTQIYSLSIQNSEHLQTSDNVVLTAYSGVIELTVQDAAQLQIAGFSATFQDGYGGDVETSIDTGMWQGGSTANFGISASHDIGTLWDVSVECRGLFKFNVSSIPIDATITSGTLTVYCDEAASSTSFNVYVHNSLVVWYEGFKNGSTPDPSQDGSTWSYRNYNGEIAWGAEGGLAGTDYTTLPIDTTAVTVSGEYYEFDITSIIDDWLNTNNGLWMLGDTSTTYTRKRFSSSDHATTAYRPKLVVIYIRPLPLSQNYSLTIQDAIQAQIAENVVLTQNYGLTIQDSSQSQFVNYYTFVDGFGGDTQTYFDTYTDRNSPDSNHDTATILMQRGPALADVYSTTILLKFNLSSILSEATCNSANFYIYLNNSPINRTISIREILSTNGGWIEACTWNYTDGAGASDRWAGDTGNDGGEDGGCSVSGIDYNETPLGTFVVASEDTLGHEYISELTVASIENWFGLINTNYGIVLTGALWDNINFCSSNHTTESYRPKLVVQYTIPVILTQNYGLTVQDASQTQVSGDINLTQNYSLTVNNSIQLQTSYPDFPSTPILDDFNRETLGSNWEIFVGSPVISDNKVFATTTGDTMGGWSTTFGPPVDLYFTVDNLTSSSNTFIAGFFYAYNDVTGDDFLLRVSIPTSTGAYRISIDRYIDQWARIIDCPSVTWSERTSIRVGVRHIQTAIILYLDRGNGWEIIGTGVDTELFQSGYTVFYLGNYVGDIPNASLDNIGIGNFTGNITLTERPVLTIQNATQLQTSDNIELTVYPPSETLTIQNAAQVQTSDNVVLTQHQVLGVNESTQGMTSDKVNLSAHYAIVVNNATQAQIADGNVLTFIEIEDIVLIVHYTLEIQNSIQAQTSENINLFAHYSLTVQDAIQVHIVDNINLTFYAPSGTLTIQNSVQIQTSDNTVLTQNYGLTVQDSTQTQTSDNIVLTQNYSLNVQSATQLQFVNYFSFTDGFGGDVNTACDTYVNSSDVDANFGTAPTISCRTTGRNWLARFNLSSISNSSTCTSATLYLYETDSQPGTKTESIYLIKSANADWTEDGATWNHKDGSGHWAGDVASDGGLDAGCTVSDTDYYATALGSFEHTDAAVPGTEYTASLTNTTIETLFGSNLNLIGKRTGGTTEAHTNRSSDHATTSTRPKLVVLYTVPLALTQNYGLIVQDSTQAQTADNVETTFTPGTFSLTVQDAIQIITSDNVELSQHFAGAVQTQNSEHVQTADNISLTQHQVLGIQNVSQLQSGDNITLVQHQILAINNAIQVQEAVPPYLFRDDFESGNTSKWNTVVDDGGNLSVSESAALLGNFGLQSVVANNNSKFVEIDHFNSDTHQRVRFYINIDSISLQQYVGIEILTAYSGIWDAIYGLAVYDYSVDKSNCGVELTYWIDGNTPLYSGFKYFSSGTHCIEIEWKAASFDGSNDGYVILWVDGNQEYIDNQLDTDTRKVDRNRLGTEFWWGGTFSGIAYLDDFILNNTGIPFYNILLLQHQISEVNTTTQIQTSDNVVLQAHYTLTVQNATQAQDSDNIILSPHNIYSLTVNNATQAQTANKVDLIAYMFGILTIQWATHGQTADNIILTQHQVLSIQSTTQLQTSDNVILSQKYTLAIQNTTQLQTSNNVALTQHQILSMSSATQLQTSDSIALFAHYTIITNNSTQAQTSNNIILVQHQILSVRGATQIQTSDNVALSAHYSLTIQNTTQLQTSDDVSLIQHQILVINGTNQIQTAENTILSAHYTIVSNNAYQTQTSENVVLIQNQILIVNNSAQAQTSENVVLIQHQILTVNNAAQAQTAGNVALTQHQILTVQTATQVQNSDIIALIAHMLGILTMQNDTQAQSSENVILIQHQVLFVQSTAQAQTSDNIILSAHYSIITQNNTQTQTANNIILSQNHSLGVQNSTQLQTSENLVLTQHFAGAILVQNTTQIQTSQNIQLTQHHVLTIQSAVQTQTTDIPILLAHYTITVNDSTQLQTTSSIILTFHNVLVVNDTTQTQTADNITLIQHYVLFINTAVQLQTSDNIILTSFVPVFTLSIYNTTHTQTSEELVLVQSYASLIDSSTQLHTSDNIILTQNYVLNINDATHRQTSSLIYFVPHFDLEINNATHIQTTSGITFPNYLPPISFKYRKLIIPAENRVYVVESESRILYIVRGDYETRYVRYISN